MPNLLSDASKWTDESGGSPPSYWSGTAYDFLRGYGPQAYMTATAAAGDIVSYRAINNSVPGGGAADAIFCAVNGETLDAYWLYEVGEHEFTSPPLAAGDVVRITVGTMYETYAVDATIVPLGDNAFWTDFVGCIEV